MKLICFNSIRLCSRNLNNKIRQILSFTLKKKNPSARLCAARQYIVPYSHGQWYAHDEYALKRRDRETEKKTYFFLSKKKKKTELNGELKTLIHLTRKIKLKRAIALFPTLCGLNFTSTSFSFVFFFCFYVTIYLSKRSMNGIWMSRQLVYDEFFLL